MGTLLSVPVGSILYYFAEAQNETLPSTYAYCQGQTLVKSSGQHDLLGADSLAVPDLRNKYLIGASRTKGSGVTGTSGANDSVGGAPGVDTALGLNLHVLTILNLPDHTHSASMGTGVQADLTTPQTSHGHTITVPANGGISHTHSPSSGGYLVAGNNVTAVQGRSGSVVDTDYFPTIGAPGFGTGTQSDGDHSHAISISPAGAHTHAITVATTGSNGVGFDGRPYTYALVHIMKVLATGLLSVPLKTVLVYRADAANETLPDGFVWANGQTLTPGNFDTVANSGPNYVVPDLRNRFIIGADVVNKVATNSGGSSDSYTDAPGVRAAFGTQSHTISITAEMPQHSHDVSQGTIGNHDHGGSAGSTNTTGAHVHVPFSGKTYMFYGITSQNEGNSNTGAVLSYFELTTTDSLTGAGDHTHSGSSDSQGGHYHAISVSNAGSGTAWDRRPLFHGLVFAIKVKN